MKPKRSLGQNFLTSQSAIDTIVRTADLSEKDTVLEIGPGKGALTKALLATGTRIVAIEKDDGLFELLSETFAREISSKQLTLVHGDTLEINIDDLIEAGTCPANGGGWKLVSNIPYNITGEILRKFLSEETIQPERVVILVQKEVAERIAARNGKESILSISVKAYGTPKIIGTVSAGSFHPKPNVDSAILAITDISRERLPKEKDAKFFKILKQAFSQKRKQLVSTLAPLMPRDAIIDFLASRNLPATARAEELSIDDWIALCS